MRRGFRCSL